MRIFKNRGDIYFSKSNKQKSREQSLLLISLAVIVVFTVIFTAGLGLKYHFSAKEFFAPDEEVTVTQNIADDDYLVLPEVSGKTNFIFTVTKEGELLFAGMLQADMDNVAYKTTLIKPQTVCDGESLAEIYRMSGINGVQAALEQMFTTTFDFYVDIDKKSFESLYDDMSDVSFPIVNEINYKDESSAVEYSVKMKAGEQKINGGDFVNLIRYYLDNDMCQAAGDLMLSSLQQHINPEFNEEKDELFTQLVSNSTTNITVRDFSIAESAFIVLTNEKVGVGVYNAYAEYSENEITDSSVRNVRGYYSK